MVQRCTEDSGESIYLLAIAQGPPSACQLPKTFSRALSLYRYHPARDALEQVGPLDCPHYGHPDGIALNGLGEAYATDSHNNDLFGIRTATAACSAAQPWAGIGPTIAGPGALAYVEDGAYRALYVLTERGNGSVFALQSGKLSARGLEVLHPVEEAPRYAKLTSSPDGQLYYASTPRVGTGRIHRVGVGGAEGDWPLTPTETDARAFAYWNRSFYLFVPSIHRTCDPNVRVVPAARAKPLATSSESPVERGHDCYDNGLDSDECGSTSVLRIRPSDGSHARLARWRGLSVIAAAAAPCPPTGPSPSAPH